MDKRYFQMLKELNLLPLISITLVLRSPFDLVHALLNANMLERFLRVIEQNKRDLLSESFFHFFLLSFLLFAVNLTIWFTLGVRCNIFLQKRFRKRVLETVLSCTPREMEQRSTGDWIMGLNSDIDKTCDYLLAPLNFMHMVIAIPCILGSSLILIRMSPFLYLVTIAVMIPFFILSNGIIMRKVPEYKKTARCKFADYTNWIEPMLNAQPAILLYDGKEEVLRKVEENSLQILRENMKCHRQIALTHFVNIFSGILGYLLLLFLGNSMIGKEIADFAMLIKITQYRGELMKSTMVFNSCLNNMRTNLAGVERIYEILHPDVLPADEQYDSFREMNDLL